jgi:DNA-binding transcriptional ArsR family regulator
VTEPFEELAGLDRLVHEPARLAILAALRACTSADFVYLRRLTGLSDGNLSRHLAKLQDAGLVLVTKRFVGRTPNTVVELTSQGRASIDQHARRLLELFDAVRLWSP